MLNGWTFERGQRARKRRKRRRRGGDGSRCTVRVLFWNIHSNVGPAEMMANAWAGGWG